MLVEGEEDGFTIASGSPAEEAVDGTSFVDHFGVTRGNRLISKTFSFIGSDLKPPSPY